MNEKKNNDILTLDNKKNYQESGNFEMSAQRGKKQLLSFLNNNIVFNNKKK